MESTRVQSTWFARTISESQEIQGIVDQASKQYERFDDAWRGLQWLLARKGHEIGATKVHQGIEYRLHKQAGKAGQNPIPDIIIVYTVGVNEIDIVALRASEPPSQQEDVELE